MDDAPMRRNRPSVHVKYGEANAILAAFAMVALAARSAVDPVVASGNRRPLEQFQRTLLAVLDAGSLIQGQAMDLECATPACSSIITELKTVPLFELAVDAGGVSAPAFKADQPALRKFAWHFGRAFQLVDDYLDGDIAEREPAEAEMLEVCSAAARFGSNNPLFELVDYLNEKLSEDRSHR